MRNLIFFSFTLLLLGCKSDDRYTDYPTVDISVILPERYIEMNHIEYYNHFINKNIDSSFVKKQSEKIFQVSYSGIYLQDTTSIYENMLIVKTPYFNINQSTFKDIKKIAYNQLVDIYQDRGSVRRTSSSIRHGYYPYAKLSFDICSNIDTLHVTWYTINKEKTSVNIFVNSNCDNEFEDMIKTLL